ncbi:transcriptional regulator, IclR family [Asanoa ishikariensis]|uniref:Transcriptional regulator, IclR family n=1 Tax=Asanoa ishikariensis TaxID=137265 RepID=A0A1H3T4Q3_9ACTN|nr:IclR family transcriptional regulator [Asanoa ishikariensis]SDZ44917.1 transcriptional regulator, IclR family [Asanoa ishikariensis]
MAEQHSPLRRSSSTEPSDAGGVRSVQRAMEILSLLTETQPSVTIREIVDRTGLAKTTVIRLVQTLEQNGLLWATSRGYTAGPGLWRWAHLAQRSWEVPPETRQLMRDLAAAHRETVNLYMTRDVNRVCVAQEESPQALRHVVRVGDELPMWAGASSKVLLHDAGPAMLVRIATNSPWGDGHADTLREWAREATANGYATSAGEREPGLSAVAVPVTGRSVSVVAALCLSGPTLRFTPERVAEFIPALQEAAARMSEKGFDHPLAG